MANREAQSLRVADQKGFSGRMLAEAGVMLALAKVLSFVKLFEAPFGGSVTLASMAPILFFAIRWGVGRGMIVGAVYGLLDFILDPFVYHPIQVILDYPLAYAMLGLAGLVLISHENPFIRHLPGIVLAVFMRFVMHVISGCIFFSSVDFTQPGASLTEALSWANISGGFVYSVTYNAGYLVPDLVICLVVIALVWRPLGRFLNRRGNA